MHRFNPSLLDKLLGAPQGAPSAAAPGASLEQVKASVARDIEALLNARPGLVPARLPGHPQAACSLLTFGLPDISAACLASDRDRRSIVEAITDTLRSHEPRLRDVQVGVRDESRPGGGLCFSIHAHLQLAPYVEPVAFDAVLQPGSNRYAVSSGCRAWRPS
ncbi:type VI secretion system baseplate subunit TssE [Azohydromonas aeria]|uniref:type VI secretion system baseplate subunit TssE n=1 Tax=Azohydromonas aeria TaxID=2590212 RepID=UPI0012FAAECA|nr:type VI secretion system baseplate subunit TssE [Azohydromonas aeria]